MNATTPDLPPEPGSVPDLSHGIEGDPAPYDPASEAALHVEDMMGDEYDDADEEA